MWRYIINRLTWVVPVLLAISILVFSMLHLVPGDPVRAMFVESGGCDSGTACPNPPLARPG